jgi:hypothetical protein
LTIVSFGKCTFQRLSELLFGQAAGLAEEGMKGAIRYIAVVNRKRKFEVPAVSAWGDEKRLGVVATAGPENIP